MLSRRERQGKDTVFRCAEGSSEEEGNQLFTTFIMDTRYSGFKLQ